MFVEKESVGFTKMCGREVFPRFFFFLRFKGGGVFRGMALWVEGVPRAPGRIHLSRSDDIARAPPHTRPAAAHRITKAPIH